MVKTVKVTVQYTFFIEIVGIFGFICNEGTGVRVYSGGRRMVPSPTPLFFLTKMAMKTSLENLICCLFGPAQFVKCKRLLETC